MNRTMLVGGAAAALVMFGAFPAAASTHRPAGAVFVQTDNPDGNTVVAYSRAADGRLTQADVYPTGGKGGVLAGSVVDHLASQGSLTLDDENLYAVNAGSNSLTVFRAHGTRLFRVAVVPSGGDFPVSVTAHGSSVYVLNARSGGSIQGFRWAGSQLVPISGSHRDLGFDATATPEFTHTPGQIAFTPNGSSLVVTTKAAGNSIDVFPLDRAGRPSASPVVNSVSAVPFGVTFAKPDRLVVSEAGTNSLATFDLSRSGVATLDTRTATGQAATCWVVRADHRYYASNAGSGTLTGFDRHLGLIGNTSTAAGTVDAAATPDGKQIYVQTGAAGGVDGFAVQKDGSLVATGSVTVPGAVGGEGIAAS